MKCSQKKVRGDFFIGWEKLSCLEQYNFIAEKWSTFLQVNTLTNYLYDRWSTASHTFYIKVQIRLKLKNAAPTIAKVIVCAMGKDTEKYFHLIINPSLTSSLQLFFFSLSPSTPASALLSHKSPFYWVFPYLTEAANLPPFLPNVVRPHYA